MQPALCGATALPVRLLCSQALTMGLVGQVSP